MIKKIIKGYPAPEFDGRVLRVLAHETMYEVDPFLMLDFFDSEEKELPTGSWHPHRGIETFTYITRGNMKERDTLNGELSVSKGGALHLSAGSGIYHTGVPTYSEDGIQGFQIWFNIPKKNKMDTPFTQAFQNEDFPHEVTDEYDVKVLTGFHKGLTGPLDKSNLGLKMLDVTVNGKVTLTREAEKYGYLFVYGGSGTIADEEISYKNAYILDEGEFTVTGDVKFLFAEGTPLKEPIAWRGPIVMNTNEELIQAFNELNNNTFIKEKREG